MTDFFTVGGYGFYVWFSYGVTLVFILAEIVLVSRQRKSVLQRLRRMVRMNSRGGQ